MNAPEMPSPAPDFPMEDIDDNPGLPGRIFLTFALAVSRPMTFCRNIPPGASLVRALGFSTLVALPAPILLDLSLPARYRILTAFLAPELSLSKLMPGMALLLFLAIILAGPAQFLLLRLWGVRGGGARREAAAWLYLCGFLCLLACILDGGWIAGILLTLAGAGAARRHGVRAWRGAGAGASMALLGLALAPRAAEWVFFTVVIRLAGAPPMP